LAEGIYPRLDKLHKVIRDSGFFLEDLSIPDFTLYYFVNVFKDLDKELFTKYAKFKQLLVEFEKLPTIANYYSSSRYKKNLFMIPQYTQWNTTI